MDKKTNKIMNREIKDKEIKKFVDKYLKTIRSIYSPKGLWFFGSRVVGKAKEDSDIDMILISEKFREIKFIHRMGEFLKQVDFPRHIDAICYTPEEFSRKKNEIGMISEALQQGIKII